MEGSFNKRERRRYPRFIVDLPLEYRDMDGSCLRGGILVNASEGGFLIEAIRDIPVGTELNMTVLFPKGFELADFNVVANIVWKEPYWKEDSQANQYWEGYRYGLELIRIFDKDRWRLNHLLDGGFESEGTSPIYPVSITRNLGADEQSLKRESSKVQKKVLKTDGQGICSF